MEGNENGSLLMVSSVNLIETRKLKMKMMNGYAKSYNAALYTGAKNGLN